MQMFFKYILLLFSILFIVILLHRNDTIYLTSADLLQLKPFTPEYFNKWNDCAQKAFLNSKEDEEQFWRSFQDKSKRCDSEAGITNSMKIIPLQNRDEMKYAILPVQKSSKNVFVTLGIGLDIRAEEAFQKMMKEKLNQNVSFYGADPIFEDNAKIYSKIGQYFPFAVGAKAGFSEASIYVSEKDTYAMKTVVHIDLYYFLKEVIQETMIDYFWIDAEYAEYGFLDMFYRNGRFGNEGLSFCQMSLEVHGPSKEQKKQFQEMIETIVNEKNYGFFLSQNVGHMRMWLFNFGNHYCTKKFLGPI